MKNLDIYIFFFLGLVVGSVVVTRSEKNIPCEVKECKEYLTPKQVIQAYEQYHSYVDSVSIGNKKHTPRYRDSLNKFYNILYH